jgi:spermidine synthase
VVIGKNKWWGNIMWLDGVLNVTERDEFVYHEMIVHVPMMTHPDPRRVLIVGGGDGGAAREVLKHPNLEKVVMIDIDEVVVNECKKHMPSINGGAFEDPRLELIIGDGIDYVKKAADESFDVIIVDSTDPIPDSVGEVLFSVDFYENCKRALAPNGVVSTQSLMPMRYDTKLFNRALKNVKEAFAKDHSYIYLIPTDTYNGQTSLTLSFKEGVNPKRVDKERVKAFGKSNKLRYYNYNVHNAAFCLPNYLKEGIS